MTDADFPYDARLHQSSEFKYVFRYGKRWLKNSVTVIVAQNAGHSARLGLAVARRQIRLAVDRNRLKRLSREAFRANKRALSGFDLVILPRHEAQFLTNREFSLCLHQLLRKIARPCDTV